MPTWRVGWPPRPGPPDWWFLRSEHPRAAPEPRVRCVGFRVARWWRFGCEARRASEVLADMVEGVVVANGLRGDAAVHMRTALLAAVAAAHATRAA